MPRIMRLIVASVILSPLYLAPVTVVQSSDGLPAVEFSNACAFASCAPKPGWDCIHWFPDGTMTKHNSCDPNDYGCVVNDS